MAGGGGTRLLCRQPLAGPVAGLAGQHHNFFSTRFRATRRDVLGVGVRAADAEGAWAEAVGRYLGPAPTAS